MFLIVRRLSPQQQDTDAEDGDSSHDDDNDAVAMETTTATLPVGRHDSLKAKKRALLAALAQKRHLEATSEAATPHDNQRFSDNTITFLCKRALEINDRH